MDSIASKRAKERLSFCKIDIYCRRLISMKIMSVSAIAVKCRSSHVWWGHRIPAWYRGGKTRVQIKSPGEGWKQDEDTLDTWFSSWLWAYETMDPKTRTKFYPTSVLVTGPDIIFFWVARMIIAGLELKPGKSGKIEDNIPFHDVFFTGIIRDKQGRKMSKSLGNSPDPLELIDKYGADGLRFGLM